MVFINKCKYSRLHGGYYYMITKNKTSRKQKALCESFIVVFQFLIQKYYTWQNNTFWHGIISTKRHDGGGLRWTSIK